MTTRQWPFAGLLATLGFVTASPTHSWAQSTPPPAPTAPGNSGAASPSPIPVPAPPGKPDSDKKKAPPPASAIPPAAIPPAAIPPAAIPPAAIPPAAIPPAAIPPAAIPPAAAPPPYGQVPASAYAAPPPGYQRTRPRKSIPYREGLPTPWGYAIDTRPRRGLVIAGATTTGALWFLSTTAVALSGDHTADKRAPLFVPVVGPFIAIGTTNPGAMGTFGLVANGIGQVTGALLFTIGMTKREKYWRHEGFGSLSVSPIALGKGRYGLGLQGTL